MSSQNHVSFNHWRAFSHEGKASRNLLLPRNDITTLCNTMKRYSRSPLTIACRLDWTPAARISSLMVRRLIVPMGAPSKFPTPPLSRMPPITFEAIALISNKAPFPILPAPVVIRKIKPEIPAVNPQISIGEEDRLLDVDPGIRALLTITAHRVDIAPETRPLHKDSVENNKDDHNNNNLV